MFLSSQLADCWLENQTFACLFHWVEVVCRLTLVSQQNGNIVDWQVLGWLEKVLKYLKYCVIYYNYQFLPLRVALLLHQVLLQLPCHLLCCLHLMFLLYLSPPCLQENTIKWNVFSGQFLIQESSISWHKWFFSFTYLLVHRMDLMYYVRVWNSTLL